MKPSRLSIVGVTFLIGSAAHFCMAQKAGSFTPAGNTNVARRGHTATLLTNGSVLIAGGWAVS